MAKRLWSLFIFLIFFIVQQSYSELSIHKIEIDAKGEGFFKNVTDMVIINDKLILADFTSNKVFCFRFAGALLEFSKLIGLPGQGPGDIQNPLALSAFKDRIAIKDQESISIFNTDGKFLSKFRQFSAFINILLGNDRIYYMYSNPSDRYLIGVFSIEGKWLSNMMEKKMWVNSGEINTKTSFREKLIYDGQLWLDGDYLFYISRYFGFIEKYSLSGELLLRKDISRDLGDNARTKSELNKKELIQSDELKLDKGRVPNCNELFLDSYFEGGYIYLLMSQYDILGNKPISKVDIRRINASDLCLSSSYSVGLKSKEWLTNLCVRTINNEPVFIIDIRSEEGRNLFELNNGK